MVDESPCAKNEGKKDKKSCLKVCRDVGDDDDAPSDRAGANQCAM